MAATSTPGAGGRAVGSTQGFAFEGLASSDAGEGGCKREEDDMRREKAWVQITVGVYRRVFSEVSAERG
jgi:hypothetical protein